MTDAQQLDEACAAGPIAGYWGCDATAPSLHVGNLMGLMVMKWFQETGHHPILLVGGGTTKIGDPSGRDTTRQLLNQEAIDGNIRGIHHCFSKIISLEDSSKASFVDNNQWLEKLQLIPFLRDIGVHFSVNRMLGFDSVKSRLDRQQPLSYIEFNYLLFQAYDFLHLYQDRKCMLQVGGSDQWGNIVSGVDLVRRVTGDTVFGLTWPLLETASGAKMGKTAQGAIWLHEDMCTPYDYWQFWRNTEDADVIKFMKLYTTMPLKEIHTFAALQGKELDAAKIVLADQATALMHGAHSLQQIQATVQHAFSGEEVDWETTQLPCFDLASDDSEGVSCVEILETLGFVSSRREARQKIREGAITMDGHKILDELYKIFPKDLSDKRGIKISLGAKRHGVIRYVEKK
jgi:tyrosyl-tRNA synthetase